MLNGFAAGILVVDFSLHLVKAALGSLIPGSERFVLFVPIFLQVFLPKSLLVRSSTNITETNCSPLSL